MSYALKHRKEKERERAAARRYSGLCVSCNNPSLPGRVRCAECTSRQVELNRKYQQNDKRTQLTPSK